MAMHRGPLLLIRHGPGTRLVGLLYWYVVAELLLGRPASRPFVQLPPFSLLLSFEISLSMLVFHRLAVLRNPSFQSVAKKPLMIRAIRGGRWVVHRHLILQIPHAL